jgi:hypothetical protein
MKSKKMTLNSIKRKFTSLFKSFRNKQTNKKTNKKSKKSRRVRRQRGGYSQYMSNIPNTPSYQVAGIHLKASDLGLANPPPIKELNNCPK